MKIHPIIENQEQLVGDTPVPSQEKVRFWPHWVMVRSTKKSFHDSTWAANKLKVVMNFMKTRMTQ